MSVLIGRLSAAYRLASVLDCTARRLLSVANKCSPAHAVVVRGVVTDALGRPMPAARVQLIQGPKAVASGSQDRMEAYEIRFAGAGRFVLLTSAATFSRGLGRTSTAARPMC